MTIFHKEQAFGPLYDRDSAAEIHGRQFDRCVFSSCVISLTDDSARRTRVRDVVLRDCYANGCDIGPAVLEDVVVENLRTNDLLIVWGALFRHVELRGSIGKLKINKFTSALHRSPDVQEPFARQREAWYRETDWALDISAARFKGFDVRGIPAHAFRRDPETQVVVTRQRLSESSWRERLDPAMELWPFMLKMFEGGADEDLLLVAPTGAPKAKRDPLIAGLKAIRTLGIAEPD